MTLTKLFQDKPLWTAVHFYQTHLKLMLKFLSDCNLQVLCRACATQLETLRLLAGLEILMAYWVLSLRIKELVWPGGPAYECRPSASTSLE